MKSPTLIVAGIPSPPISGFQVGQITVHFYALCLLVGVVIAVVVTNKRPVRRKLPPGKNIDITLWAIPVAIIGGRPHHVAT